MGRISGGSESDRTSLSEIAFTSPDRSPAAAGAALGRTAPRGGPRSRRGPPSAHRTTPPPRRKGRQVPPLGDGLLVFIAEVAQLSPELFTRRRDPSARKEPRARSPHLRSAAVASQSAAGFGNGDGPEATPGATEAGLRPRASATCETISPDPVGVAADPARCGTTFDCASALLESDRDSTTRKPPRRNPSATSLRRVVVREGAFLDTLEPAPRRAKAAVRSRTDPPAAKRHAAFAAPLNAFLKIPSPGDKPPGRTASRSRGRAPADLEGAEASGRMGEVGVEGRLFSRHRARLPRRTIGRQPRALLRGPARPLPEGHIRKLLTPLRCHQELSSRTRTSIRIAAFAGRSTRSTTDNGRALLYVGRRITVLTVSLRSAHSRATPTRVVLRAATEYLGWSQYRTLCGKRATASRRLKRHAGQVELASREGVGVGRLRFSRCSFPRAGSQGASCQGLLRREPEPRQAPPRNIFFVVGDGP